MGASPRLKRCVDDEFTGYPIDNGPSPGDYDSSEQDNYGPSDKNMQVYNEIDIDVDNDDFENYGQVYDSNPSPPAHQDGIFDPYDDESPSWSSVNGDNFDFYGQGDGYEWRKSPSRKKGRDPRTMENDTTADPKWNNKTDHEISLDADGKNTSRAGRSGKIGPQRRIMSNPPADSIKTHGLIHQIIQNSDSPSPISRTRIITPSRSKIHPRNHHHVNRRRGQAKKQFPKFWKTTRRPATSPERSSDMGHHPAITGQRHLVAYDGRPVIYANPVYGSVVYGTPVHGRWGVKI